MSEADGVAARRDADAHRQAAALPRGALAGIRPNPGEGSIVNLHPMVWAAWFGMLATALNLLPFGQLDGGHITYATLGKVSTRISLVTVAPP